MTSQLSYLLLIVVKCQLKYMALEGEQLLHLTVTTVMMTLKTIVRWILECALEHLQVENLQAL